MAFGKVLVASTPGRIKSLHANVALPSDATCADVGKACLEPATAPESVLAPPPLPALPSTWQQDYELHPDVPVIGSGAFGTVFQVRSKYTHQAFASKVVQRGFLEARGLGSQILAEIQTMQCASSSCRVVKLCGAAEEAGCIFLLQELCPFGTLEHELRAQASGFLADVRARRCSRHLLQGLLDLHNMGILHRDIKLDNLLVSSDGSIKLTDFGWATGANEKRTGPAGTFCTMAPEVLRGDAHTAAVDLWSAGAVIFHLTTGRALIGADVGPGATKLSSSDPEGALNARQRVLLEEIMRTCNPLLPNMRPSHVSSECWDLLGKLLQPNPEQRLTASEALQHVWLREPVVPRVPQLSPRLLSTQHGKSLSTPRTATPVSSARSSNTSMQSTAASRSPSPGVEPGLSIDHD